MMLTEWGKQLDKSCPLSEYPRPQFVRDSYVAVCLSRGQHRAGTDGHGHLRALLAGDAAFRGGAHLKAR